MNTNTLEIYQGQEAIAAARLRGEPIIAVPEAVAAANLETRLAYAQAHKTANLVEPAPDAPRNVRRRYEAEMRSLSASSSTRHPSGINRAKRRRK